MGGFHHRIALALAKPRFQFAMLVWVLILANLMWIPLPGGLFVDTHVYRNAWDNLREGRDAYLVPDPTATAQAEGLPIYFFPPPPAALVGGPIASLPAGDYLWLALNLAMVAAAFAVTRRLVPAIPAFASLSARRRTLLALGAWLLFPPMVSLLVTGNQNSFFLLGLSVAAYGVVRQVPVLAAMGLATAVLLKPAAILFALPLVTSGRWREGLSAAGLAAGGFLLSLPFVGFKGWVDFAEALLNGSSLIATQGSNMSAIQIGLSGLPHAAWVGLTAVFMALAGRLPTRTMLAVSICLFLIGWPVLWSHYAVLALVAIAVLGHDERLRTRLGLAYALLAFQYPITWLGGTGLLLLSALHPGDWRSRLPLEWQSRGYDTVSQTENASGS